MIARMTVAALLLMAPTAAVGQVMTLDPGEVLTEAAVVELLGLPLADGRDHRQSVDLSTPSLPMRNPASQPVIIALVAQDVDSETRRFTARLSAALPTGEASDIEVTGRIIDEWRVPVADRLLQPGEVVDGADLSSVWMADNRVPHGAVLATGQIVGAEVRRRLRPGRPVEAGDLQQPRLVRRGEAVEVIYRHGGLTLTTLAEALDDGTLGQLVRLSNLDSGRRFAARVEGRKRAVVGASAESAR